MTLDMLSMDKSLPESTSSEDESSQEDKDSPKKKRTWHDHLVTAILIALVLAYHGFLIVAIVHSWTKVEPLVYLTIFIWTCVIYGYVLKPQFGEGFEEHVLPTMERVWIMVTGPLLNRIIILALFLLGLAAFLVWDTWGDFRRLSGLGGIAFFILFMVVFSNNRRKIRWRTIVIAFAIQFVFALAVLRWPWGQRRFQDLANLIVGFLDYAQVGYIFVYGFAADPPPICGMSPIFVFTVLQVLVFFNAFVSLMYYLGAMQFIMKKMAWLMQKTLGASATESLNAVTCPFLGMTEGPMLIAPYIENMTASELHAIMTSGFACISGSLFAAYISFGACPVYLLSSSIMSAPGAFACSKLLYPEEDDAQLNNIEDMELVHGEETSAIDAITSGAIGAVQVVAAIAANLIVFMAGLAFISAVITYAGELIGYDTWTLEGLFSYLFFPLAYLMGVNQDTQQTLRVAQLMGTKTTINEFVAYQQLGDMVSKGLLDARSQMIATYALCGFSNFGSTGMPIALLGSIAPNKKPIVSSLVMRCLLAGSISCFFTATIAGVLTDNPLQCTPSAFGGDCVDMNKLLNMTLSW